MRGVILTHRGHIEVQEVPEPSLAPGLVKIAPAFVSICGTDVHVYLGEFEQRVSYPARLGHEFAGVVTEVGPEVTGFQPGDRVVADPVLPCGACDSCRAGKFNQCQTVQVFGLDTDGAMAEAVVLPWLQLFRLPEGTPLKHGVTIELYAVVVHAVRRTPVEPGDVVVVLGAGRLGLTVLDVIKETAAAAVVVTDRMPARLRIAEEMGADLAINVLETDPVEAVLKLTSGRGADKIIEAIGDPQVPEGQALPMQQAVSMMRPGGQITAMGQGGAVQEFFWRPLVLKEGSLLTSRLNLGDTPRALGLLERGALHPQLMLTHEMPIRDAAEAFGILEGHPEDVVKIVLNAEEW